MKRGKYIRTKNIRKKNNTREQLLEFLNENKNI